MFLKLLLICAWLASAVLTTISRCVFKYKKQTNICPNNNSIYYIEPHTLTYSRPPADSQQVFKT